MEVIGHWILDSLARTQEQIMVEEYETFMLVCCRYDNEHGHGELGHKENEDSYNKQLMCRQMFNEYL